MKKLFLLLSLILPSICFANDSAPQIFIMLDIDNTLVDKITTNDKKSNNEYAQELAKNGFVVQNFEFYSIKGEDPFFDFYKNQKNTRLLMDIESEDKIKVSEMLAIRPSMISFLKEIATLKIPVHILICSRSGNIRVKNLVDNLQLEINNKQFKDLVDFVPREKFRVEIKSGKGSKTIGKSAWELRKNYAGKFGKIKKTDYVILIDQLTDNQFIYSNPKMDLNVYIPPFYTKRTKMLNLDDDKKNMEIILKQIKDFAK